MSRQPDSQNPPTVSVVIVNWNGEKWLKRCLSSLEAQDYPKLEVIVVDNGSSDHSRELIRNEFPSTVLVTAEKNLGFASGNNLGIKRTTSELIMLLNNDTWVSPDFVSLMVNFYQNNQGTVEVVGPMEANYSGEQLLKDVWSIDIFGHPIHLPNQSKQFFLSGVCLLFSKRLYLETGGLDEDFFMYFEEIDWFWRLNLIGATAKTNTGAVVNHAGAGSTGDGVKFNSFLWRNQNVLQMLLKNYSVYMLIPILILYLAQNIFEVIFFSVTGKMRIASTYFSGWVYNLRHLRETLKKRKTVQSLRRVREGVILSKMFHGPAKLYHLLIHLKLVNENR